MKTKQEVTPEKLRGGFYTPPRLVAACLERVRERLPVGELRFLEPSAGDGAFVRALADPDWHPRVASVTAIEPLEIEAEKCSRALKSARLPGGVLVTSALTWSKETEATFDAAVGNPPFVRYQFISALDRAAIERLGARVGIEFAGVANLWIPLLLGTLERIRPGGAFAFVIPTECLTGCSATVARQWLIDWCDEICFDLFAPGSFPEVLQEVLILSGRKGAGKRLSPLPMRIVEHEPIGATEWTYLVSEAGNWTRHLLDPTHLEALQEAQSLPLARRLGDLVAFEVSIVTGANDFFSVDDETLTAQGLSAWARPLLPRMRHAPGLVFTAADRDAATAAGASVWLLDFSAASPDPMGEPGSRGYLEMGKRRALDTRYKCRIREPWYRVPGIVQADLLLSKRSHHWPRVVVNEAGSFTTDTIYRGRMVSTQRTARDVAAAFHNSFTLLSAELEGRSFGGGVLELVPSEIARLTTIVPQDSGRNLRRLDRVARADPNALVSETDRYLISRGALPADLVPLLAEARMLLAARRLDRNRRTPGTESEAFVTAAAA